MSTHEAGQPGDDPGPPIAAWLVGAAVLGPVVGTVLGALSGRAGRGAAIGGALGLALGGVAAFLAQQKAATEVA